LDTELNWKKVDLKKNNNEVMLQDYVHGKFGYDRNDRICNHQGRYFNSRNYKKIRVYSIDAGSTSFEYFSRNNFKLTI